MLNNGISVEALVVLDAIDKRGSFAAAAAQLNKVPSALSYIVQKLEDQLGVSLFVKNGRRSVLTPAGQHLLLEGRKLLNAIEQIGNQTKTIAQGWEPSLNIAIDSILDIAPILEILSQFLNNHPTIEINIFEEVMMGSWEALIEDKVDIVIGAPEPAPTNKGLSVRHYIDLEAVLVCSPKHQLTKSNKVINETLLRTFRTIVVKDSVKSDIAWTSNVIEQSQHLYVQTLTQKIAAIQANLGIGFLPKYRINDKLQSGELVVLDHQLPFSNPSLTVAWKTANRGKALAAFRNMLLHNKNQ